MKLIRTRDDLAEILARHDTVYVRYSHGPENNAADSPDYGPNILSADQVHGYSPRLGVRLETCYHVPSLITAHAYTVWHEHDGYGWLLTGEYVGTDDDGKSLVRNWTCVGRLDSALVDDLFEEHLECAEYRDALSKVWRSIVGASPPYTINEN